MVLKFKNIDYRDWSPTWKSSKQPRKQRKYLKNAPLHIRRKLIVSHLSKELKEILGKRSIVLRVGDYVRIERGKFRGKEGYVIYVDTKNYRVYVDVAYIEKKNGEKSYYPLHPSKLTVLKLNLTDKKRVEAIKEKKGLDEEKLKKLLDKSITSEGDIKKVLELAKEFK